MAEPPVEDDLVLPPLPLATGRTVRLGGTGHRVSRVELVVSTEDGEELRIPLEHHHGGWWPPPARTSAPAGVSADRVSPADHLHPEG
ncbi:hypothetical protein SAMN06893096_1072 [Geodermatophilus pulveris]|uniref:Uncharacterized protein n=1 Tax=Geodermatophilus pulveris TaxID=1564159 RepID=A0A239GNZ5_9ACTN|nr:hypothetical protein [Geodermatophilus pulveris]SNS70986.1 hypothetical protein SAMN06893096_1072 [Geodermatophilus pulveris]